MIFPFRSAFSDRGHQLEQREAVAIGINHADLAAAWENPAIAEAVDADRQAAKDPRNSRCSRTDFCRKILGVR